MNDTFTYCLHGYRQEFCVTCLRATLRSVTQECRIVHDWLKSVGPVGRYEAQWEAALVMLRNIEEKCAV